VISIQEFHLIYSWKRS